MVDSLPGDDYISILLMFAVSAVWLTSLKWEDLRRTYRLHFMLHSRNSVWLRCLIAQTVQPRIRHYSDL